MEDHDTARREYEIRVGMTTRTITLRSGERVSFVREAIEKAADEVNAGLRFLPVTEEHLSYLPPRGRIHRADIVTDQEGHADLVLYAVELPLRGTQDLTLETQMEAPDEEVTLREVRIAGIARNFERSDWLELQKSSPLPLQEHVAWSMLPPIIWALAIPVTWGLTKFAGSFLDRLGVRTADGLVEWFAGAGRKAKDAHREQLVKVEFETEGGMLVSGFIPFEVDSIEAIEELRAGLNRLGPLAQFAGAVAVGRVQDLQLAAFIYADGRWNLAWWAAPDEVYISPWFSRNYPDPRRFLGGPLIEPSDEESTQSTRELPLHAD